MKGYKPWIYVNYCTLLSVAGRLSGRPGPDVKYEKGMIYSGAERLVLFNLAERFRIETAEIQTEGKPVKCPFHVRHLIIIATKSGSRVRTKAVFPK